jgi:hypothetical protein
MSVNGLYVYGLMRTEEARELGSVGLEHEGAPARVYPVAVDGVAAIVSAWHPSRQVVPLRRHLEPHHGVIRSLIAGATVVPMTFGHVARSRRQLERLLRTNAEAIGVELDRLQDKVEMGLKVRWEVENIYQHIIEGDTDLAAFRDHVFADGNVAPPSEKIELGRRFEERLRGVRADLAERLVGSVQSGVLDVKSTPPADERVVADIALLIPRDRQPSLAARVREVAAEWPAEYAFEVTGPWAPYNFVELRLHGGAGEAGGRDGGRAAEEGVPWAS